MQSTCYIGSTACFTKRRLEASSRGPVPSRRALAPKATAQKEAPEETSASETANVCVTCGINLDAAPRGCDQKGRVAGGLGAVADWWPIKAYRPCPALTQAGMNYTRKGQITDEMLFGRQKQRKG